MRRDLLTFYLDGRGAKLHKLRKVTEDFDDIAKRVLVHDQSVRAALDVAVGAGASVLKADRRFKTAWLKENDDAIQEAGVRSDDAFEAYVEGLRDELAFSLEPEVLEAIEEEIDGPSEDDEDEDHEEDDDDGEEDGGKGKESKASH
jgi:hypothetical protein